MGGIPAESFGSRASSYARERSAERASFHSGGPISSPAVSWEPELEELRRREELARQMGGEERVARQHASGRLTVRERIERLFDPGTFRETGAIAGQGQYEDGELVDFLPANMLVGHGRIDGRRAVV